MKFKRRGLISLFILCLSVTYSAFSILEFYSQARLYQATELEHATQRLPQSGQIAHALYQAGMEEELIVFLEDLRSIDRIHSYTIYRGQGLGSMLERSQGPRLDGGNRSHWRELPSVRVLAYAPRELTPLAFGQLFPLGGPHESERNIEYNLRLAEDTVLSLALLKTGEQSLFWASLELGKERLALNFLAIISIAALLIWWNLRDLRRLVDRLHNRSQFEDTPIEAQSREAEILIRGIETYEWRSRILLERTRRLEGEILPALRGELDSGRRAPYNFECTLVRTDINGFSNVFNSPLQEHLIEHINAFFTEACECISRYGGLVYEFIGDEVIFYIKDNEQAKATPHAASITSVAKAAACVGDLNAIAERYDQKCRAEKNYRFTIKSALAHGSLRYGQLVNGHSLSGPPLIESVRILSNVQEKDVNLLYFDERHRSALEPWFGVEWLGEFELKGINPQSQVHRLTTRPAVTHWLDRAFNEGEVEKLAAIGLYRSDHDLARICLNLREYCAHQHQDKTELLDRAVFQLRESLAPRGGPALAEALVDLVDAALKRAQANSTTWNWRLTASSVMLILRFIPPQLLTSRLLGLFEELLASADSRTVANSVEAFSRFDSNLLDSILDPLQRDQRNRVAANAILRSGLKALDQQFEDRLRTMLSSPDPGRQASGLWVLGEIVHHYDRHEPVTLATRPELLAMVDHALGLIDSDNEMIQRQARRLLNRKTAIAS